MLQEPIKIYDRRGGEIENIHQAHAVVMNGQGDILETWGNVNQMVCPRSSLKFIQAIPLVETGASEALSLDAENLSLACASHNSEAIHYSKVDEWLSQIGVSDEDLECGGHWPLSRDAEHELVKSGKTFCNKHNNCSGKHAGMVSSCKHMKWQIKGYTSEDHPLQILIKDIIAEMSDTPVENIKTVIDGCSAPNHFLPLKNVALMFSRFISGKGLSEERYQACQTLMQAVGKHPELIAGEKRLCSDLARASKGDILGKVGAMGNYIVLAPKADKIIYSKIEDGNRPAVEAVTCALMKRFDLWGDTLERELKQYATPITKNCRDLAVGDVTVEFPS